MIELGLSCVGFCVLALFLFKPDSPVRSAAPDELQEYDLADFAIVALNPAACSENNNGVVIGGSLSLNVQNGGIFSNGCMDGDGNNWSAWVYGGGVYYVGEVNNFMNIDPLPVQVSSLIVPGVNLDFIEARCALLPDFGPATGGRLRPGNYTGKPKWSGSVELTPGLYCLMGFHLSSSGIYIQWVPQYMRRVYSQLVQRSGRLAAHRPGLAPILASSICCSIEMFRTSQHGLPAADALLSSTLYAPSGSILVSGRARFPIAVSLSAQFVGFNVGFLEI
jgi:hypothetical protein